VQTIHSSAHANHRLATKITTQIGGSARGYQELPAQSSTPTTASGQAASSYVYALSALV
jgi:hypothetical protein